VRRVRSSPRRSPALEGRRVRAGEEGIRYTHFLRTTGPQRSARHDASSAAGREREVRLRDARRPRDANDILARFNKIRCSHNAASPRRPLRHDEPGTAGTAWWTHVNGCYNMTPTVKKMSATEGLYCLISSFRPCSGGTAGRRTTPRPRGSSAPLYTRNRLRGARLGIRVNVVAPASSTPNDQGRAVENIKQSSMERIGKPGVARVVKFSARRTPPTHRPGDPVNGGMF
jgi:hypothetical protein